MIREAVAEGRPEPALIALPHALFPFLWNGQPDATSHELILSDALQS